MIPFSSLNEKFSPYFQAFLKTVFSSRLFEENFFAVKNLPQIPTEKDTDFRRLTIRFGKKKL